MFLFTLVLGLLFLQEADNLKCRECSSAPFGICTQTTTECPSLSDRCVTATKVAYTGGMFNERNVKSCIVAELCLNFSVNNGTHRLLYKSSCCSEDLCNAQTDYPEPDNKFTPNGKKCFSCQGENCMKTLYCVGDENYCFKETGNVDGVSLTDKGCVSEALCSDQFSSLTQLTGAKFSCCQGDYCNSASSASPALLLLLVPLLFSNLFS
uniref:UPAR/Ly6 domain-containing protein n=1 Tax=Poecilia reticulata TaxID=8081 RepID=A0A3P9NFM1_POERE